MKILYLSPIWQFLGQAALNATAGWKQCAGNEQSLQVYAAAIRYNGKALIKQTVRPLTIVKETGLTCARHHSALLNVFVLLIGTDGNT